MLLSKKRRKEDVWCVRKADISIEFKVTKLCKKKNIHYVNRKEHNIFTRMVHTRLNATLHFMGKHNTDLCNICHEMEIVEHPLIRCTKYEKEEVNL